MARFSALFRVPVVACGVLGMAMLAVGESKEPELRWKLTVGDYFYGAYSGKDLNLRWRDDNTDAWLGVYSDPVFGTQSRGGLDKSLQIASYLQVQPSVQFASRGFAGGSLSVQAGGSWYGIAGIGRTNVKPYFNLNFDPNDAVTIGFGHRTSNDTIVTVFVVADDRLGTGQRDWHINAQLPFGRSHATLDLLHKTGLSDAGQVNAWGFSANWDSPTRFLRLAYDPYQNFSAQNAVRLAGGVRF